MTNMEIWDKVKQPPPAALREIKGGRLKGKTDINPQWRYQVMTEQFGMCGVGWRYEVVDLWAVEAQSEVIAFAKIMLFTCSDGKWSDGIPGVGGSMLVAKEASGLHVSDEAYKMAITDALSVAMKMLGVAANIYSGMSDSKHSPSPEAPKSTEKPTPPETSTTYPPLKNVGELLNRALKYGIDKEAVFEVASKVLDVSVTKPTDITDPNAVWAGLILMFSETIKAVEDAK